MCVFWYPLSFRADKVSHVTWLEMMPFFQLVEPTCWGCQFQSLLIRERLAAVFKGTKRRVCHPITWQIKFIGLSIFWHSWFSFYRKSFINCIWYSHWPSKWTSFLFLLKYVGSALFRETLKYWPFFTSYHPITDIQQGMLGVIDCPKHW